MTQSAPWRLEWNITQPGQLEDVLAILAKAVSVNGLEEIGPTHPEATPDQTLRSVTEAEHWPDVIDLTFRDQESGELYRLSCETYHGAGGRWGTYEPDTSR